MASPLPRAIAEYFAAADRDDVDALVNCFADDAVVLDENNEWHGRPDIRRWRETVATKYDYELDVRAAEMHGQGDGDERVDVQTHLEGNFPGGTVDLDYRFTLREELISKLEIVPTSSA